MRNALCSAVFLCLLHATLSIAWARVKTPKSANARGEVQTHKAHGKHLSKKIKTNRSKLMKHPKA